MSSRTVRFRARAASDVEAAVDDYRREAGEAVALDFIESLEQCVSRIRRSPHVGTLRYSYELGIPELRVLGGDETSPDGLTSGELTDAILLAHRVRAEVEAAEARLLARWDADRVWQDSGAKSGAA